MVNRNRVSPTEIESREDSLTGSDTLADYTTIDRGLRSIERALRRTVIAGTLVMLAFIVLGSLYVVREETRTERRVAERNELLRGVCETVEDVTRTQVQALIAASTLSRGEPPSDEVLAAYVNPIEESLARCSEKIPRP